MTQFGAASALPIVDTHVHFWDLRDRRLRYSWLEPDAGPRPEYGDYAAIKSQRYWPDDYLAETRFSGVSKSVHVQAATGIEDPVEETRWLEAFSERLGHPHGIVAAAELDREDAEAVIERHAAFPHVRGIRDLRYDTYLSDDRWRRGFAALEKHGLLCCIDPLVEVMGDATDLASKYPGIVLCIDHASFPRSRDKDYFEAWRSGMRSMAEPENTIVKISGLGMCDNRWTLDSLRPWVLECIELWSPGRVVFGTNWPLDRLFSSYPDVVNAHRKLIGEFSRDEQVAMLSANAERVFHI